MRIQKSFKDDREFGTLYLVPTPIGNLKDMTFRAVELLKQVDFICAEDTRNTGQLLKHFGIDTKQLSFHEHNAFERIPQLLDLLQSGKSLAQVSDAGMPSISDPGHDLVQAALDLDIPVVSVPGASAGITALIASGLAPQPHTFYGFLPRKKGQQEAFFNEKKTHPETQIFYESPYRVSNTLELMLTIYGDRRVVLVRELTKLFEEYQRGTITELLAYLKETPPKGECLILVEGAKTISDTLDDLDVSPLSLIDELVAQGMKSSQAIKQVAKQTGVARQELYQQYHDSRN